MLDQIPTEPRQYPVFRMAAYREDNDFLQDDNGLDQQRSAELIDLLRETGTRDSLEELLEDPFRPKRRLQSRSTRFSDGSFAVFYSSLDQETAEAEVRHHWCAKFSGKPDSGRVTWYQRFKCNFKGYVKDLRTKQEEWSDLTHNSDYGFCNKLGTEAKETRLDGLLAPSARRNGGTNLPVFVRSALSDPRDLRLVRVACDPS